MPAFFIVEADGESEGAMAEQKKHLNEAQDSDYETGAVEDGGEDTIQILPVWASTEPFGYGGDASDKQVVGGGKQGSRRGDAGKSHAERDIIGPDAG